MPIAEVTALITSAKAAYDIAKGISSLSVEVQRNESISKILEVLITIQGNALAVQEKHQKVLEKNYALATKLKEFEEWSEIEKMYELKDIGGNVFVYVYKPTNSSVEPIHYLCTNCHKDKKKSILQCLGTYTTGTEYFCPACNLKIVDRTKKGPPPPPRSRYYK